MELLWKGLGIGLICCILGMFLGKQEKDFSQLLSVAGCIGIFVIAVSYLRPIADFFACLEDMGSLHSGYMEVIFKALGVGIITEIASVVFSDSGNQGLGKTVSLLGSIVVLWLSIPVFKGLLELIGVFLEDI